MKRNKLSKNKKFDEGEDFNGKYFLDKKRFSKEEALKHVAEIWDIKISNLTIESAYMRFLPKTPKADVWEYGDDGVYTTVDGPQKGAFEIWVVE